MILAVTASPHKTFCQKLSSVINSTKLITQPIFQCNYLRATLASSRTDLPTSVTGMILTIFCCYCDVLPMSCWGEASIKVVLFLIVIHRSVINSMYHRTDHIILLLLFHISLKSSDLTVIKFSEKFVGFMTLCVCLCIWLCMYNMMGEATSFISSVAKCYQPTCKWFLGIFSINIWVCVSILAPI